MAKKINYRYNPETDNFERIFPTVKARLISGGKILLLSCFIAFVVSAIAYYYFETPTERHLKEENKRLKTQYSVLSKRLDNSLKVMNNIRERDDNFYRVLMQLEPSDETPLTNLIDNESRYREIRSLPDEKLVDQLSRKMNLLEHQLFTQIQSFESLKKASEEQQDRLAHIPSVLPINVRDYTMSSGYGYREDPIYGTKKFHEGLDFAATQGTDVFATADGKVSQASRRSGYGNCIDIDHGNNYLSRYAHLSEILVRPGENVRRGQLIGKVGSTGKSTGPHLHYEVRFKDEPQNPVNYYFMDLSPTEYSQMIQRAENAGHVMD